MSSVAFTVIIPTKNRADTLRWAISSCLMQSYENLVVIVSDNNSTDNTREVVHSFGDNRLRYINTGESLSMSGNWEFALSQVQEGFVTFVGDDDALLPDVIGELNEVARETGCDAINAPCIEYCWPNHVNPLQKNKLFFVSNDLPGKPEVDQLLPKVFRGQLPYSTLPWLYKGFVSVRLINEIKAITGGRFFYSAVPDIYSAIAISSVIQPGKYYYRQQPFAVNGASSHSNGVSQGSKEKNAGAIEFLSAINIPFHSSLVMCNAYPLYIYECYLQARDAGLYSGMAEPIQLEDVLSITLQKSMHERKDVYEKTVSAIRETAAKNNIPLQTVTSIINKYPNKLEFQKFRHKVKNRYFSGVSPIDMNDYQTENVYDAAIIAAKMIKKEILLPSQTARLVKTITNDIKYNFQK